MAEQQITDVLGTCLSVGVIAEKYGIREDEVEESLLDEGIEACTGCDWWFNVGELVDNEGENEGYRDECRADSLWLFFA